MKLLNINFLIFSLGMAASMSFAVMGMESESQKAFYRSVNPHLVNEPTPTQKELKAKRSEMLANDSHEKRWWDPRNPGSEANCEVTTLGDDRYHCSDCGDYKNIEDAIDYNYSKQSWSEWWNENKEPEKNNNNESDEDGKNDNCSLM